MFAGRGWASLPERERTDFALAALVVAVIGAALALSDGDPDLWGRMAYARDAFAAGRAWLPGDPYSYTAAGHTWIDHEWGFSWLMFAIHSVGGWPLLRLARLVLAWKALAFAGGAFLSKPMPKGLLPLAAVLLVPPLFMGFGGPRAQAVTFVCFAWMLRGLARDRVLLAVAPFPLWANMHGGFLAGCGVLGVWGVIRMVEALRARDWRVVTHLVLAALWSGGSGFATIWGPGFPLFLVETATMPRPFVPEWGGFDPLSVSGVYTMGLVAITALTIWRAPRRIPLRDLGATAVTALAAFNAHRHNAFLALAVLAFVLPHASDALNARAAARPEADVPALRVPRIALSVLAVLALVGTLWICVQRPPHEPDFPERSVAWMREKGVKGNVLVDFDWAQYVIYQLHPDVKLAFDGRFEAAYPTAISDLYWAYHVAEGETRDALVDDPRTERVLVKNGTRRADRMSERAGWTVEHEDGLATLYVRVSPSAGSE